jgi:hypothetical protein
MCKLRDLRVSVVSTIIILIKFVNRERNNILRLIELLLCRKLKI